MPTPLRPLIDIGQALFEPFKYYLGVFSVNSDECRIIRS